MIRRSLWVVVCFCFLFSQAGYAGFSLCFWKKKAETWKTVQELTESRVYTLYVEDFLSKVDPSVKEQYQARVDSFIEKAKSDEGLNPRDWFALLEKTTLEIRDFLQDFRHKKNADKLFIRVSNRDSFKFGGGWFKRQRLVFPKKIESSEALAKLLLDLTKKVRNYNLRKMIRRSKSFWRPDVFYMKRYKILRALEADIKLNEPLRDAEFLIQLSLMRMPLPASMLDSIAEARNRLRDIETQDIAFRIGESPYEVLPRNIEARYWSSQFNPRNWLGYIKEKWFSVLLMVFLFYQFEQETPDDDVANFGGVIEVSGEGPEGHRFLQQTTGTITREMIYRAEDGSRRVRVQFERPDGSEILSYDLGAYVRVRDPETGATLSRGVQLEPALQERYEAMVEEVIGNRYMGESFFETLAHSSQTRYLSYGLGKRLGLWVYFSTMMQNFGLTYDNLVFHADEWSPDQVRAHLNALIENPNHELPGFLLGLNKELWKELAHPPVNTTLPEADQAVDAQERREANRVLFDEMLMQYELVAQRPIFAFIRQSMEDDMATYEQSQTYDTAQNALSVVATFFVASKVSIMGRALTSAGIVPTTFGATALVATPNLTDDVFEWLEDNQTHDQEFWDQDAYVIMWQSEYRTFLARLNAVTQHATIQSYPLIDFLKTESVQRNIRIPQLRVTGQRLALMLQPEIQARIQLCLSQPTEYLNSLTDVVTIESEIDGFMESALSYPTICELLVLTTESGEIKDEDDEPKALDRLLRRIVIRAPQPGTQNEAANIGGNSAVGAFNGDEGLLEVSSRQGWSEHVKYYVFAEELWHGFLDQRVANQMKRYPSKEQFIQACALHEYIAHLLQVYLMKEKEESGVPLLLWVSNTSHTLGRIWDDNSRVSDIQRRIEEAEASGERPDIDPSELQGTYETTRLMHMLEIMPERSTHSMIYQLYQQKYAEYYDTR